VGGEKGDWDVEGDGSWMDGRMDGWMGGPVIVCWGGEMVEEDCMRSRGLGAWQ